MQPVELIHAPAVRVTDVFARPDIASGRIQLQTTVRNDSAGAIIASLEASVAPAAGGSTIVAVSGIQNFPEGNSIHNMELHVPGLHLWDVDDPYLYRVSVRLDTKAQVVQQGLISYWTFDEADIDGRSSLIAYLIRICRFQQSMAHAAL